jgi:hypothetical protein
MRRIWVTAALTALAGTTGLVPATASAAPAPASVRPAVASTGPLLRETFSRSNGLVTNEYAHWNRQRRDAVTSRVWDMTSGSLFASGRTGYSGVPDAVSPDARSAKGTDSAVFRLNTRRHDFRDVKVAMRLNVKRLSSTRRTPKVAWDGIHLWLRYQSQYRLYYASVNRRDGHLIIKKKCPGGPSNGGTYHPVGAEVSGRPVPYGKWQKVAASARNNRDGSVTITMYRDGRKVLAGTDRGVGCAPITAAGSVGVRGDNAEFRFDDFTVTRL